MFKKQITLISIILIFQFCHSPVKPITEGILDYSQVANYYTNGYVLDVDILGDLVVIAANYDGTYLLNVISDENGNIESLVLKNHLTNWEANIGEEKANKVLISEDRGLIFIMDMNDRIYLYKLDGEQYSTNYLSGCFGDNWRDFAIDDSQLDSIFIYPLIKHDSAEPAAPYDAESTSIVSGIIAFDEFNSDFELNCSYGVNHSYYGEYISISDSLIFFSEGELGISVYKQNANAKLNNEYWDEGEEFVDSNENGIYDSAETFDDINENGIQDTAETFIDSNDNNIWDEGETFDDCGGGFCFPNNIAGNGIWDAYESFEDLNNNGMWDEGEEFTDSVIPTAQFDLPGEIETLESYQNVVFTGHSYNKGCYMSFLDQDGGFLNNISFADGYNIRGIATDGNIIALASGYDGIFIYEWVNNSTVKLLGNIASGYANAVKVNNNIIYTATRDGLEIYKIER